MSSALKLCDLRNVGPAALGDFAIRGVESVAQLATCAPVNLYHDLQRLTGRRQDLMIGDQLTRVRREFACLLSM